MEFKEESIQNSNKYLAMESSRLEEYCKKVMSILTKLLKQNWPVIIHKIRFDGFCSFKALRD